MAYPLLSTIGPIFQSITTDQIIQIAIYVAVIAVAWIVMRAIFKITMRIFTFGCGAIILLGLVLIFLRILQ